MSAIPFTQDTQSHSVKSRFSFAMTIRSAALLLLIIYLLIFPIAHQADIIASVIAFCLIALLLSAILFTLWIGRKLTKSVSLSIVFPGAGSESARSLVATHKKSIFLKTSPLNIPPLFALQAVPEFEQRALTPQTTHIIGSSPTPRLLEQKLCFPHRGRWILREVAFHYGDSLGLCAVRWGVVPFPREFYVVPEPTALRELPVISSSHRPGDSSSDVNERLGDPFDLKAYHPSDGLKRILWKVYAKSGELIARHPERSMTPEGHTLLFIVAGKKDDHVAAASLAYISQLENAEIAIFAGCQGMPLTAVAHNRDETEELLIDSVWEAETADLQQTEEELTALMNSFRREVSHATLTRVLIFLSKDRLQGSKQIELFIALGQLLEQQGIAPVFFLFADPHNSSSAFNTEQNLQPLTSALWQVIAPYLFYSRSHPQQQSSSAYQEFVAHCGARQWQVII